MREHEILPIGTSVRILCKNGCGNYYIKGTIEGDDRENCDDLDELNYYVVPYGKSFDKEIMCHWTELKVDYNHGDLVENLLDELCEKIKTSYELIGLLEHDLERNTDKIRDEQNYVDGMKVCVDLIKKMTKAVDNNG